MNATVDRPYFTWPVRLGTSSLQFSLPISTIVTDSRSDQRIPQSLRLANWHTMTVGLGFHSIEIRDIMLRSPPLIGFNGHWLFSRQSQSRWSVFFSGPISPILQLETITLKNCRPYINYKLHCWFLMQWCANDSKLDFNRICLMHSTGTLN